jgi:single-strand DNA-binding protein
MNLRNRVQLIGNLGASPVIREFENVNKAEFSVATNEVFTRKGEKVKETTWHRCVAWGKSADILAKFVKAGDQLIIEGKLVNRSYEDKNGVKKYISEVQVFDFVLKAKPKAA